MEKEKIKYEDLSVGLKIAVVISYVVGTLWLLTFLISLIISIAETI